MPKKRTPLARGSFPLLCLNADQQVRLNQLDSLSSRPGPKRSRIRGRSRSLDNYGRIGMPMASFIASQRLKNSCVLFGSFRTIANLNLLKDPLQVLLERGQADAEL